MEQTYEGHGILQVPRPRPDRHPRAESRWLVRQDLALELGGCYTPLFLVVEADSMSDAIDELSDNETYGHQIHVPDEDLGDYPEDDRHYDGSGRVIDLDYLMIYGQEGSDQPYPVKYHGDGLPAEGIDPRELPDWDTD